jgi:hypothetical protein
MAVPKVIQKQLDEAEAAAKAKSNTPNADNPADPAPPSGLQPADRGGEGEGLPPAKTDPEDYKARFASYKAATDNTIREQREQISGLTTQLTQLNQQMEQLKTQMADPPAQPSMPDIDDDDLSDVPKEILENYDEAWIRDMKRMNKGLLVKAIAQLRAEIADIKGSVTKVTQSATESAKTRFYADLDDDPVFGKGKPYFWEKFDPDPAFRKWLSSQVDETIDQRQWGVVLQQSIDANNASGVKRVLQEFMKQTGRSTPENTQQNNQPSGLDNLIAPEAGGGGDVGDSQPETFSQSYVQKFYTDWSKGKYTDEAAKAIERRIQRGRVVEG